jgi:hypothetical protein
MSVNLFGGYRILYPDYGDTTKRGFNGMMYGPSVGTQATF